MYCGVSRVPNQKRIDACTNHKKVNNHPSTHQREHKRYLQKPLSIILDDIKDSVKFSVRVFFTAQ